MTRYNSQHMALVFTGLLNIVWCIAILVGPSDTQNKSIHP